MEDEIFAFRHEVAVISPLTVPLKQREFREMEIAPLPLAKALRDLKDSGITRRDQPLHAKLGRGLEVPVAAGWRFDMLFGGWCGDADGGFDLEVVPLVKKLPESPEHCSPRPEGSTLSCQLPGLGPWIHQALTRVRYSPVRVSTRIFSPWSIKVGTRIR